MVKPGIREEARARRRAISPEERAARSAHIVDHALALPEMTRAQVVGCYVSVRSEVETPLLLRALLARGTVVAVPALEAEALRFVRLDHPWALTDGPLGIPVPRQPWTDVAGEDLEIVFVPGLQFGRDGSRLGNGGGHFDRFLAAHPKALRVGLAFREQLVERVPTEPHDEGLDVVVTDDGRVRAGRAAASG